MNTHRRFDFRIDAEVKSWCRTSAVEYHRSREKGQTRPRNLLRQETGDAFYVKTNGMSFNISQVGDKQSHRSMKYPAGN